MGRPKETEAAQTVLEVSVLILVWATVDLFQPPEVKRKGGVT